MKLKYVTQQGFTLVELVMVLVLLAVLSISAIGLFASRSSYATFVAKDVLISQALLAQQIALANPQLSSPSTLTISASSDTWVFSVQKSGVAQNEIATVEASGNSIQVDGATLSGSTSFTWNNQAGLSASRSIRFLGENSYWVCLSSEGIAYESNGGCP